jgi:hypothetical protein
MRVLESSAFSSYSWSRSIYGSVHAKILRHDPSLCAAADVLARRASGAQASPSRTQPRPLPRRRPCGRQSAVQAVAGERASDGPSSCSTGALVPRRQKLFDVVALSNLCVDVVVPVDRLPPPDEPSRRQLLTQLTASPPPRDAWEVGGNSNFLIAASRLGLRTASIGHVGADVYGNFLAEIMKVSLTSEGRTFSV